MHRVIHRDGGWKLCGASSVTASGECGIALAAGGECRREAGTQRWLPLGRHRGARLRALIQAEYATGYRSAMLRPRFFAVWRSRVRGR